MSWIRIHQRVTLLSRDVSWAGFSLLKKEFEVISQPRKSNHVKTKSNNKVIATAKSRSHLLSFASATSRCCVPCERHSAAFRPTPHRAIRPAEGCCKAHPTRSHSQSPAQRSSLQKGKGLPQLRGKAGYSSTTKPQLEEGRAEEGSPPHEQTLSCRKMGSYHMEFSH